LSITRARRAAGEIASALVVALLPADCLLCGDPLPFRQRGSVCLPCWGRLPWTPGLRLRPEPLRALLWSAEYRGPVRRLIQVLKFEGLDYLGPILGEEMATRLAPLLAGPCAAPPRAVTPAGLARPDLVVPVPLHWWRRCRRGFNQALLLAGPLARRLGLPMAQRLLVRRRPGRRQLGLSRRDRLRSLEGCYAVARRARTLPGAGGLAGRTVLLVDDVATTGATLEACARVLRRAGAAAVIGCVLARTPRVGGAAPGETAADDAGLRG
jgi:ComF family protein